MSILKIGRVRPSFKGEFQDSVGYLALDLVRSGDWLYVAIADRPADSGRLPGDDPDHWAQFGGKGDTGRGITSFTLKEQSDSGDIWEFTFSDGAKQEFKIPKGNKGDKGNGIVGIAFDRVLFNGDYAYVITYDNGDTDELVAPRGPELTVVKRPEVTFANPESITKYTFTLKVSPYASAYQEPFFSRVVDVALDSEFVNLVATVTIEKDDEEKNTLTINSSALAYDTTYYVRAQDKNESGDVSAYSATLVGKTNAEIREIQQPQILAPTEGQELTALAQTFSFSEPAWVASTGAIDNMRVILSLSSGTVVKDTGWIQLSTSYSATLEWGTAYKLTVQYKESATGFMSAVSATRLFTVRNTYVVPPTVTIPAQDAYISGTNIDVAASPFVAVGIEDTHVASYWFIYEDAALTMPVYQSGRTTTNLTANRLIPNPGLSADKDYWIVVQYEGAVLSQSLKGNAVKVKTGKVSNPSITSPLTGESVPKTRIEVSSGPFTCTNGTTDTHIGSLFYLFLSGVDTVIHASPEMSGAVTSYVFPDVDLEGDVDVYVRVKYRGKNFDWSDYSPPIHFVLSDLKPFLYSQSTSIDTYFSFPKSTIYNNYFYTMLSTGGSTGRGDLTFFRVPFSGKTSLGNGVYYHLNTYVTEWKGALDPVFIPEKKVILLICSGYDINKGNYGPTIYVLDIDTLNPISCYRLTYSKNQGVAGGSLEFPYSYGGCGDSYLLDNDRLLVISYNYQTGINSDNYRSTLVPVFAMFDVSTPRENISPLWVSTSNSPSWVDRGDYNTGGRWNRYSEGGSYAGRYFRSGNIFTDVSILTLQTSNTNVCTFVFQIDLNMQTGTSTAALYGLTRMSPDSGDFKPFNSSVSSFGRIITSRWLPTVRAQESFIYKDRYVLFLVYLHEQSATSRQLAIMSWDLVSHKVVHVRKLGLFVFSYGGTYSMSSGKIVSSEVSNKADVYIFGTPENMSAKSRFSEISGFSVTMKDDGSFLVDINMYYFRVAETTRFQILHTGKMFKMGKQLYVQVERVAENSNPLSSTGLFLKVEKLDKYKSLSTVDITSKYLNPDVDNVTNFVPDRFSLDSPVQNEFEFSFEKLPATLKTPTSLKMSFTNLNLPVIE